VTAPPRPVARRTLLQDDRAEAGPGALILFITMVAVSAGVAAQIIEHSEILESRAATQGEEADRAVATTLEVRWAFATRPTTSSNVDKLKFTVTLSEGSPPTKLSEFHVRYSDGVRVRTYTLYGATNPGSGPEPAYNVTYVRDVSQGGFDAANKLLSPGDLVEIAFGVPASLVPHASASVILAPSSSAQLPLVFTLPGTFGSETVFPIA
jgi:archaellin